MSKHSWDSIIWWERRRLVFNLALLAAGLCTIAMVELIGARYALPGDDIEEPIALVAGVLVYGIAANLCYTLGWITELMWSNGDTSRTEVLRSRIYHRGLVFSIALTLLPAVVIPLIWVIWGFQHDSR